MLRKETITPSILKLIVSLQEKSWLNDFFLVGGTGLALQLGHRKSDDIDFFTTTDFNQEEILQYLESDYRFQLDLIDNNTLKGTIDRVKIDLLSHKYPLINPLITMEGIRLASKADISAMKINAISNDGTRVKDFIDLFYLLHDFSVDQLLGFYSKKYTLRNSMHALKSMNFFDDVVVEGWPEMVRDKSLTWKRIMKYIDKSCRDYAKSLS